jgi:formylglycine-generating enzyme required for sulfatase activity
MYPAGASPAGVLDMAGTVWEWCLDPFETAQSRGGSWLGRLVSKPAVEEHRHVLRGGAWYNNQAYACSAFRLVRPNARLSDIGFRVVCSSPIFGH